MIKIIVRLALCFPRIWLHV